MQSLDCLLVTPITSPLSTAGRMSQESPPLPFPRRLSATKFSGTAIKYFRGSASLVAGVSPIKHLLPSAI